ncbi:MAG: serine/threonine protein kinase [Lachnospiraceae bacterium]|nr:serine/threonine protein kinase [Lachnospiraceae bacterium]
MQLQEGVFGELESRGYKEAQIIGKGAFSKVWRVWDSMQGCYQVCKISPAGAMAEREAQMLRCMAHPLFPQYVSDWTSADKHYLIMEYVCGSNLGELLVRRGRFSQRQAVYIAMEVAQGLSFLHERSEPILFRDVKPDNVMLRQDGRVKLVDVGCACLLKEGNTLAGSRGYSAPEQFMRGGGTGEESDVYALGALLYYMLTGDRLHEVTFRSKDCKRMYHSGISYGLIRLIEQAMKEERQCRIPDMGVFIKKLTEYQGKRVWKREYKDRIAQLCGIDVSDYFYVQNIRRGMDNF